MSHDGQPKWSRETIEDMRRALTAEYSPERGLTDARKGFGGGTIGVEPESEAQRVAEIERAAVEMERAGITGPLPDCMMPDGDMPCAGFRSLAERLHARASTAEAKAESPRAQLDDALRIIEGNNATYELDMEAVGNACANLRAQLAEYRAAITALDCWMEKHDPKARSDYWRWRHRYHAIVNDARGDHE
ncbi:MAG: hypothetical protein H6948_02330 [Zoogloeaceae bacterium]|nr:hypothetical protein [Zoogloeaceae bacterium]